MKVIFFIDLNGISYKGKWQHRLYTVALTDQYRFAGKHWSLLSKRKTWLTDD